MHQNIKFTVLFFVSVLLFNACNNNVDCNTVTYSGTIVPIVQANCLGSGCHGSGSTNGDYTQYTNLKLNVDNGKLENRVLDKKDMPPDGLSRNDRNKIKCWIEAGAPNN